MEPLYSRDALQVFQVGLKALLEENGAADNVIRDALTSGYYLRTFGDPFSGNTWVSVSDSLYGNKQFSSSFEPEAFVDYAMGRGNSFSVLPEFQTFVVKSQADIDLILSDPRRASYLKDGSMTFRGQPQQYFLRRRLPNPVRSNERGEELSILAGVYRQQGSPYSFELKPVEQRLTQFLPRHLFSGHADTPFAYDPMRVEQHYATQTRGLDLSFDVEVAIFFATHRFQMREASKAFYEDVPAGAHSGVVYAFRFRDPPVKRESFLIREFDLFRDHIPERVLRQNCGLPLMGDFERNIAITDLDCILQLHPDYSSESRLTAEQLFPSIDEDRFYAVLLEQKDKYPELLASVVEYAWAR
ncbi:MAG TPA: hypothetical protein VIW92_10500 [Thermoanaerobaculia bacterium]